MYKQVILAGWCALTLFSAQPALAQQASGQKQTSPKKAPHATAAALPIPFGKGLEYGTLRTWAAYDFVPGSQVVFQDELTGEDQGEYPSHWEQLKGQLEVAIYGSDNALNLRENGTAIRPVTLEENWLPDTATIEMDVLFESDAPDVKYSLYLLNDAGKYSQALQGDYQAPIEVRATSLKFMDTDSASAALQAAGTRYQWRHVSIGIRPGQLDVYLDQEHLLHLPHVQGKPTGLRLEASKKGNQNTMVRHVFVTQGRPDLRRQLLTSGKAVTQGIKFEPVTANMRPESAGVLYTMLQLLQAQPKLRLRIEGHSGGNGDEKLNQQLSQRRAQAVKAYLVNQGIAPERLEAKGWGTAKPLDESSREKAAWNNNRIEFTKL